MVAMEHKVEMTAFRTQVTAIEGRLSTSEQAGRKGKSRAAATSINGEWHMG